MKIEKTLLSLPEGKGRLMPQAPDAERAIICELLTDNRIIPLLENIVSPPDFYQKNYSSVYRASLHLQAKLHPVDLISLAEELKQTGELDQLGGYGFLSGLMSSTALSLGKFEFYGRIVKQKAISRKLISICNRTMQACFEESDDIADIIEQLEIDLTQLTHTMVSVESVPMEEAIQQTLKQIRQAYEDYQKGIQNGIPTHLPKLTAAYGGGFKAPELIVLGARPSMGKTQHALEMALAAGLNGCYVLFCSLEMSTSQLIKRLLLRDERISEVHINKGNMIREEFVFLDESVGAIRPAKIFFADNYTIRQLSSIKKEARRLKRREEIKFLIIDYLGLIRTGLSFSLRTQEIAYVTGELKALAKELDIAILLLSQLSRPTKGMQVRVPVMEDLRESGDIEQDADSVLLLHKPDYYDKDATDDKGVPWKDRGMLIRAKYREGERNVSFIFSHDKRYKKISDYSPDKPDLFTNSFGYG